MRSVPGAGDGAPAWGIRVPAKRCVRQVSAPMSRRKRSAITLRLSPASEERTRFRIEGTLPTALPAYALHQLLSPLVFWSGRPVHAVLAAAGPAGWFELWADGLASVPEEHLTLECELPKDAHDS
jgi:hypothetical protein